MLKLCIVLACLCVVLHASENGEFRSAYNSVEGTTVDIPGTRKEELIFVATNISDEQEDSNASTTGREKDPTGTISGVQTAQVVNDLFNSYMKFMNSFNAQYYPSISHPSTYYQYEVTATDTSSQSEAIANVTGTEDGRMVNKTGNREKAAINFSDSQYERNVSKPYETGLINLIMYHQYGTVKRISFDQYEAYDQYDQYEEIEKKTWKDMEAARNKNGRRDSKAFESKRNAARGPENVIGTRRTEHITKAAGISSLSTIVFWIFLEIYIFS